MFTEIVENLVEITSPQAGGTASLRVYKRFAPTWCAHATLELMREFP
jgi:hypothetical protein